jgi:hypothetical protein
MRKLLEFTHGEGGAEMLAESEAWSDKIMDFMQYLNDQGYSDSYAVTACGMVRSFFNENKKPDGKSARLELTPKKKALLKEKVRNSEDYLFSKEDIAKMVTIGSLKEKYVVLAGASFGLRSEDFAEITYGKMRIALEKGIEAPVPLGELYTQKERGVKAFPFINSDALPIIKAMLDGNKEAKDSDKIWNERPSQLTVVLNTLAKKSGINSHGSRIRFHNLRKYLCDRLSSVMSESKWKQIIGKKISEGAYISAESLREDYLRAMPSIVVNTNGNGETKRMVLEQSEEIKQLKTRIETFEKVMNGFNTYVDIAKTSMQGASDKDKAKLAESLLEFLSMFKSPKEKS